MNMRHKVIVIGCIVLLLLAAGACWFVLKNGAAPEEKQIGTPKLQGILVNSGVVYAEDATWGPGCSYLSFSDSTVFPEGQNADSINAQVGTGITITYWGEVLLIGPASLDVLTVELFQPRPEDVEKAMQAYKNDPLFHGGP